MSQFGPALQSFVGGQTDLPALQHELKAELSREPALAPVLSALIENTYRSGQISGPAYLDLIEIVRATTPPKTPAASAGHDAETRFRSSADGDEGETRFRDEAATVLATDPPPASSAKNTSGNATGPGWTDPAKWGEGEGRPLQPGDVVKDRFVLEDIIGRGGMGVVFRARDLRKEEAQDRHPYAALKVLGEDFKRHPESLKALQREARKAQNLAHPNIVTVYDFDRDGPNVYMVMELLEGEPLDRHIKNLNGAGLPIGKALPIIRALCGALGYAHEHQVVHSDFKPANAFLTRSGAIKVFDFGIARAAKRTDVKDDTSTMTLFDAGTLGALTPAYASCEMLEGLDPDPRDDIYALGCVAYELLTGSHPFDRKTAVTARDARLKPKPIRGLTSRQWRALRRALAFDRSMRTPTIAKFLEEISPQKRSPALWLGIAAAVLVLGATAALVVPDYLQRRRSDELAALIRAGNIEDALPGLEALPGNARVTLLLDDTLRTSVIAYFNARIETATDRNSGAYDPARAEALIARLRKLFPDSQSASQIAEGVTARRENELKLQQAREQEQQRITALKDRLRAAVAADDAVQAVTVLRDLRTSLPADDPLLNTAPKDIAAAYLRQAALAARANQLESAVSLTDKALELDRLNTQAATLRAQYVEQAAAKNKAAALAAAPTATTPVTAPPQPADMARVAPVPAAQASTQQSLPPATLCSPALAGYGTRSRGVCFDSIAGGRGPELVVVPAGAGAARPFAISRFEVSSAEYGAYCQQSGKCRAPTMQADLPVTGIAAADAQHYAEWLSAATGAVYRLPTESEWSYVAAAPGGAERDFNCVVEINGQKIRGFAPASVRAGRPNGWGLYNLIGNAQEWVKTASGWSARGGAYSDPISQCSPSLARAGNGSADELTGFRLVRELR